MDYFLQEILLNIKSISNVCKIKAEKQINSNKPIKSYNTVLLKLNKTKPLY